MREQKSSALCQQDRIGLLSLQPFQALGCVSPNPALKRAELLPSLNAATSPRHLRGCRPAPRILQPALTGGFMVPLARPFLGLLPPPGSGVSHPHPLPRAPGSSSPPVQLRAAAPAPSSGSPRSPARHGPARSIPVAGPAPPSSPLPPPSLSLSFPPSLPAASSRASDGESVTVS